MVPRQVHAEPFQEPVETRHHVGLEPDRFRQCHPHSEMRWLGLGRDRFRLHAESLVQTQDQSRAKAAGKGRARQGQNVRDARETDPRQSVGGLGIDAQGRDRQSPDPACQRTIGDDAAAVPRQGVSGPPGACNRALGGQSGPVQPGVQVRAHLLLATEEVRDTRYIGNQTLRPVAGDHRRVTACPSPQGGQGGGFAREIGWARADVGSDGSGVRQRHPPVQSAGESRQVHAMQVIGIA